MDATVVIIAKSQSERCRDKNTKKFCDSTLVDIAINKAKEIGVKEIVLNTNCSKLLELGKNKKISVFKRDDKLCTNDTTLDSVVFNLLENYTIHGKYLILINAVNPLSRLETLKSMYAKMLVSEISVIISGNETNLHSFKNNEPVNFENKGNIPSTQTNEIITYCNWAFVIWKKELIAENFKKYNSAVFVPNDFIIYPSSWYDSIKISTEKDFAFAEVIYKALREQ